MYTNLKRTLAKECIKKVGETIKVQGWAKRVRHLGNISFLVIRERTGEIQCVLEGELAGFNLETESVIEAIGKVVSTKQTSLGVELLTNSVKVINKNSLLPFEVNKKEINTGLENLLNHRVLSLRHEKVASIFKILSTLEEAFREYLTNLGFTRIFTPKIVSQGAEGGANVFKLNYLGKEAFLAQSPQFYKQMMVASGLERVFEIGSVYRAEEHNSSRHLNEYISLDVEIGFIDGFEELMELETEIIKYMFEKVKEKNKNELNLLGIEVPTITEIPKLTIHEAREIIKTRYNKKMPDGDLNAEGEKLIAKYIKDTLGSEFVFITKYPKENRPMYTMPSENGLTKSFDLLFKGLEITSGGERIHEYEMLIESIREKGLNEECFLNYLNTFKYGVPPHGGFAIGLERLTARLLGLKNVREASAFPRDIHRLTP
ncbi:aspartate--tRNA(Asn) ligase [Cytobacillus massiliigabonensis]|uniref:aspartate--tRNA(Asn) ligase n=1 Tax=Cytobacillus massiliigabonensis TaxID=1871011 RepID=UPI000C824B8E|nr:aspartate--tRNA(Asn) ligase [Cytobacillus massiliigabonensis]